MERHSFNLGDRVTVIGASSSRGKAIAAMKDLYIVKAPNADKSDFELSVGPVIGDPAKMEHGPDYVNFELYKIKRAPPMTEEELKERILKATATLKEQFKASAEANKAAVKLAAAKQKALKNVSPAGKRFIVLFEKSGNVRNIRRDYAGVTSVLSALTGDDLNKLITKSDS